MNPPFGADFFGEVRLDPPWEENYVCPCYEQLIGAGYSLYKAEESGFKKRDLRNYEVKCLSAELIRITQGQAVQHPHWQAWLSGFYLNAGLHRITWACDRLLSTFGWLPLVEGVSPGKEPHQIEHIKKRACRRIKELEQLVNRPLGGIKKALNLLPPIPDNDIRSVSVSDSNFLSIIRIRVNVQKHAIQGAIYREINKDVPGCWERLEPDQQFEYALRAFKVACDVYRDIHYLYFEEKILKEPSKGVKRTGSAPQRDDSYE